MNYNNFDMDLIKDLLSIIRFLARALFITYFSSRYWQKGNFLSYQVFFGDDMNF